MVTRRARAAIFAILAPMCLGGCTLLGNFTTEQCSVDADCGGPYLCRDSVCVDSGPGAGSCTSNLQCTAENDGKESVCNPTTGRCAELEGDGPCQLSYGDVTDDLVIYGVVVPLFEGGQGKSPAAHAVRLAIEEINTQDIPTPGTNPLRMTKVFAVLCDQNAESAALEADLVRLRDEVGVDAYLTEMPASMLEGYKQKLGGIWANELVLATGANETVLLQAGFDDADLLWHAIGNLSQVEKLYYRAIAEAVALTGLDAADVSIAFVRPSTGVGYPTLRSTVAETLMSTYDITTYRLDSDSEEAAASIVSELSTAVPDVVVDFAGRPFADFMVTAIEEAPALPDDTIYVASPGSRYSEELILTVQDFPTLPGRFVGVEFNVDRALYEAFAERVGFVVTQGRPYGYNFLYDGIYMMTYAVVAAGVTDLTPEKIADGLDRIDGGPLIVVGTESENSFAQGIDHLQNTTEGDAFQFVGTSGPLEWDDTTGSRKTEVISSYCLARETDGAGAYRFGRRHFDIESEAFIPVDDPTIGACFVPARSQWP
jgi:hypothetical protein